MRRAVPLLVAVLVLTFAAPAAAATSRPVLFVHGIIASDVCPGGEDVSATDAPLGQVLAASNWKGPLVGIAYHCGDTGGPSIQHAGDGHCDSWPAGDYSAETPIERLACDFAWYVYKTYTKKLQKVDIVAHSMGGLIVRYALGSVAAHDKRFPRSLLVGGVMTISTPYLGWDKDGSLTQEQYIAANCGSYAECQEMIHPGPFLSALASLPDPSAQWATEGGGPADGVDSYASSSAVDAGYTVNYDATSPVEYSHTNYLTDTSLAANEPCYINGVANTGCYHSLLMATVFLLAHG